MIPKSKNNTDKTTKKLSFKGQLDGFPIGQITVIALVRFSEPIAFTSIFPYLFFMVRDFNCAKNEGEIATYAGYISGCFALCQVLTGIHWGRMSDKYGRKPIIISSMFGTILGMLLLGLSTNLYMAIGARCISGLLNGNVGVLRTMIGEIAVERKHQPLAFTVMPFLWQIGCVIGPMIGGYLANPVENVPFLFKDSVFFKKYPYALPNFIVSGIIVVGLIFAFLFLEETLESANDRRDIGCEIGDKIKKYLGFKTYNSYNEEEECDDDIDDNTTLIPKIKNRQVNYGSTSKGSDIDTSSHIIIIDEERNTITKQKIPYKEKWSDIFTPAVNHMIIQTAILSLCATVFEELLPVVLSTSVAYLHPNDPNDKTLRSHFPFTLVGGLGFNSADVGFILSCNGVVGIITMITLTPWVDLKFGTLKAIKVVLFQLPFLYLIMPYILLSGNESYHKQYFYIFILVFWKTMLYSLAFPEISCLTNRSVTRKETLGTVNGVVQVATALARSIGPIGGGLVMAFSQDHSCVEIAWWSLTLLSIFGYFNASGIVDDENDEDSITNSNYL